MIPIGLSGGPELLVGSNEFSRIARYNPTTGAYLGDFATDLTLAGALYHQPSNR